MYPACSSAVNSGPPQDTVCTSGSSNALVHKSALLADLKSSHSSACPWVFSRTPAKCEVDGMSDCGEKWTDIYTDQDSFHLSLNTEQCELIFELVIRRARNQQS